MRIFIGLALVCSFVPCLSFSHRSRGPFIFDEFPKEKKDVCASRSRTERCVPLGDCRTLLRPLAQSRSDSFDALDNVDTVDAYEEMLLITDYIRNATCGHMEIKPDIIMMKVCCPAEKPKFVNHVKQSLDRSSRVEGKPVATQREVATPATVVKGLAFSCGRADLGRVPSTSRAESAPLGGWPWLVLLGYRSRSTGRLMYQCSGVLISNRHVLVAAHCLQRRNPLESVRIGEQDFSSDLDGASPFNVNVSATVVHEMYDGRTLRNNIALLKLARKIQFNRNVQPICFDPMKKDLKAPKGKERYYVAGWGFMTKDGRVSSSIRQVPMEIVDREQCRQAHRGHILDKDTVVIDRSVQCATTPLVPNSEMCQGGSAGPLMLLKENRFHLVGIASHSFKCSERAYPAVYSRIAYYANWIRTQLS